MCKKMDLVTPFGRVSPFLFKAENNIGTILLKSHKLHLGYTTYKVDKLINTLCNASTPI